MIKYLFIVVYASAFILVGNAPAGEVLPFCVDQIEDKVQITVNNGLCNELKWMYETDQQVRLYRNNLKNRFLATSDLPQNLHAHSSLGSRQWSLVPHANFADPLCQIPDSSGCFGIIREVYQLEKASMGAEDLHGVIEAYFKGFEPLARSEQWEEIISKGNEALAAAGVAGMPHDEAKICAQLTSSAFYLGDYELALRYASRCHELSKEFEDLALFVRALYLESAVHRAFAGKNGGVSYGDAVQVAEEALLICPNDSDHSGLLGKVYFNLGAAHADDPQGDLMKAQDSYERALECFTLADAKDDLIRTSIRLGKVYLLQGKYDAAQKVIDEVRPRIAMERLAMHADYLEAQLKLAVGDVACAYQIASVGLARARALGAKEDESRFLDYFELKIGSIEPKN